MDAHTAAPNHTTQTSRDNPAAPVCPEKWMHRKMVTDSPQRENTGSLVSSSVSCSRARGRCCSNVPARSTFQFLVWTGNWVQIGPGQNSFLNNTLQKHIISCTLAEKYCVFGVEPPSSVHPSKGHPERVRLASQGNSLSHHSNQMKSSSITFLWKSHFVRPI